MFSKLSRDLWNLEMEMDRCRYAENPLPPGAAPIPKKVFMLVRADAIGGHPVPEDDLTAVV
jgi:hypothetical protein